MTDKKVTAIGEAMKSATKAQVTKLANSLRAAIRAVSEETSKEGRAGAALRELVRSTTKTLGTTNGLELVRLQLDAFIKEYVTAHPAPAKPADKSNDEAYNAWRNAVNNPISRATLEAKPLGWKFRPSFKADNPAVSLAEYKEPEKADPIESVKRAIKGLVDEEKKPIFTGKDKEGAPIDYCAAIVAAMVKHGFTTKQIRKTAKTLA